jgi:hypothetical protein
MAARRSASAGNEVRTCNPGLLEHFAWTLSTELRALSRSVRDGRRILRVHEGVEPMDMNSLPQ